MCKPCGRTIADRVLGHLEEQFGALADDVSESVLIVRVRYHLGHEVPPGASGPVWGASAAAARLGPAAPKSASVSLYSRGGHSRILLSQVFCAGVGSPRSFARALLDVGHDRDR